MRRAAGALTFAAALLVAVAPTSSPAQSDLARADSLLRIGNVARAERLYFAAARRRPRDPDVRFALGTYLASRGAWRVGGVLIEEARRFGGSPERAAELLAPVYAHTGAYAALLSLGVRLPGGEAARARWLRSNPGSFAGPEQQVLPLIGAGDARSLGAIRLVIGSDTVRAEIDPAVSGLLLDRAHVRTPGVRTFDAGADGTHPAVATRVASAMVSMRNAPIVLGDAGGLGHARIGLDWLARWAPTIDLRARTVTLRRAGRVPRGVATGAERLAVLGWIPGATGAPAPGPWLAIGGGYARLTTDALLRLRASRLTYDPRRGEILIER